MSMSFGIILPTIAQKIPSYVPTNGLVGWWPFNGNANDESGNGNNGTVNGATLTADRNGKANSAYNFDGIDDYIFINNAILSEINNKPSITISYWFNTNSTENGSIWGHWGNNYGQVGPNLGINSGYSNGVIHAGNYSGCCSFLSNKITPYSSWHHVAVIFDASQQNNSKFKIFVDGVLNMPNFGNPNNTSGNGTSLYFGRRNTDRDTYGDYFGGILDDFAVWNRALSDQEVKQLYQGCAKETATLNSTNGVVLKNASPITLSASPAGGVFAGEAITNGQFTPAKANLGTNKVNYLFTNSTGCQDTTQFKVMVYDTLGTVCSSTDTLKIKVKLTTGVYSNQTTNLSVYPNPTSDVLIIDASDVKTLSGYSYRILDIQGKEVYKAVVSNAKTEISLKSIGAKGVYILHILDANNTSIENKKIVLE